MKIENVSSDVILSFLRHSQVSNWKRKFLFGSEPRAEVTRSPKQVFTALLTEQ